MFSRRKKQEQMANIRIEEMAKMYQLGRQEMWENAVRIMVEFQHEECDYKGECERCSGLAKAINKLTLVWKGRKI